jgi:hypothetical protein
MMAEKPVKKKVMKGGTKETKVRIIKGSVEVRPEVQRCERFTTDVEFVWVIKTPGWYFTLNGIDIHQDDYSMGLLHERDRRLISRLAKDDRFESRSKIRKALMAAHAEIVNPRQSRAKQFVNPRRSPDKTEFRWTNLNKVWDVYLYQVNVTNGITTLSLDPAIENEGC